MKELNMNKDEFLTKSLEVYLRIQKRLAIARANYSEEQSFENLKALNEALDDKAVFDFFLTLLD